MTFLKTIISSVLLVLILPSLVWSTPLDGVSEGYSGVFQNDADDTQEIPFELYQYEGQYILRMNNQFYHLGKYGGELVRDSYNFGFANGLYQYYGVFDIPPKVKAVVVDVFNGGVREYMLQLNLHEDQRIDLEKMVLAVPLPGKTPEYSDVVTGYYLKDSKTELFEPIYSVDGEVVNISERGEPIWKEILINLQNDCITTSYPDMMRIGNCNYFIPINVKTVSSIPTSVSDFVEYSLQAGKKDKDEQSTGVVPSEKTEIEKEFSQGSAIENKQDVSSLNDALPESQNTLYTPTSEDVGDIVQAANPSEQIIVIREEAKSDATIYVVESTQDGRLFGLFEVSVPVKREVTALGVSQKEEKPWWSIFVFT